MPTLSELATELGIDLGTLKPEAVTKWNGYLTEAETHYKTAAQLKTEAEANLAKVRAEQDEINKYVATYGQNENTMAALRANNAAMEASLKTLKEQGFAVEIPAAVPGSPAIGGNAPAFDPQKFRGEVGNVMAQGFDVNNRHQNLYGKPIPDSMNTLANEATQNRMSIADWAAKKYDFAGKEKSQSDAARKAEIDAAVAAGVKKYKEDHPPVEGNPFVRPGGDSRFSQIIQPRASADLQKYGNLPARDKVAQSVARVRERLAANQS